jgi:hypothetical protein
MHILGSAFVEQFSPGGRCVPLAQFRAEGRLAERQSKLRELHPKARRVLERQISLNKWIVRPFVKGH